MKNLSLILALSCACTCLCLCTSQFLGAQPEGYNWFFGNKAGIKFNTDNTIDFLSGSPIFTNEGCAVMSDTLGNLLFYTDGSKVWRADHTNMSNGPLLGDFSSTMSAVILPYPCHNNLYIVFTADYYDGSNGLNYSIIDMTLPNGGDIDPLNKNINLLKQYQTCEKLIAIPHANQQDYWVVTPIFDSNQYYAWLVNNKGVNNPIISTTNITIADYPIQAQKVGYMCVSNDYKKIASTYRKNDAGHIALFDFDNQTGALTNGISFENACINYSVEFSGNNQYLYAYAVSVQNFGPFECNEDFFRIYRFDVTFSDPKDIESSRKTIKEYPNTWDGRLTAFQNSPIADEIYIGRQDKNFLSKISNVSNTEPTYIENAVTLPSGMLCMGGLPTLTPIHRISTQTYNINKTICNNNNTAVLLDVLPNTPDYTYSWSPADGLNNPTIAQPTATVNQTTTYTCQIFDNNNCKQKNILVNLIVKNSNLAINLPNYEICPNDTVILNAGGGFASYLWSTGQITQQIIVTNAGNYSVTVTDDNGCQAIATSFVNLKQSADISLSVLFLCNNSQAQITAQGGFSSYIWSTADTTASITVANTGMYSVTATDILSGCIVVDSVLVTTSPDYFPTQTYSICAGDSIEISPGSDFASYLWSNGATSEKIWVKTADTLSVTVTDDNGCQAIATSFVNLKQSADISLSVLFLCNNSQAQITAQGGFSSYIWSTADTTASITVANTGMYSVTATDILSGCIVVDSVLVTTSPDYFPTQTYSICAGDSIEISPGSDFASYLWSNGATSEKIWVKTADTLDVTVSDSISGCKAIGKIIVNTTPPPIINLSVQFNAANDTALITANSTAQNYQWSNGAQTPQITVAQNGLYSVTVTDKNDCFSSDSVYISTINTNNNDTITIKIIAPTAFSPNHDHINDRFTLFANQAPTQFELHIYNRWGQKVFYTTNYAQSWDGIFNQKPAPNGSYAWWAKAKFGNDAPLQFQGYVVLLR